MVGRKGEDKRQTEYEFSMEKEEFDKLYKDAGKTIKSLRFNIDFDYPDKYGIDERSTVEYSMGLQMPAFNFGMGEGRVNASVKSHHTLSLDMDKMKTSDIDIVYVQLRISALSVHKNWYDDSSYIPYDSSSKPEESSTISSESSSKPYNSSKIDDSSSKPDSSSKTDNSSKNDSSETDKPKAALGDVNGDGNIDIEDAVRVINHVNGVTALTDDETASADIDGNSVIDIEDAVAIISHVNGIKAIK